VLFGHRGLLTCVSAIRVPQARSTVADARIGTAMSCVPATPRSAVRFLAVLVRIRKLYCD